MSKTFIQLLAELKEIDARLDKITEEQTRYEDPLEYFLWRTQRR